MARECRDLTRPSLQRGQTGPWRCAPVAGRDFVRHTLDGTRGNPANSPGYVGSMLAVPAAGCPGSPDRIAICCAATAGDVHAGNRGPRSKIDAGVEDVVEKARR